jgi:Integrase core domain
VFTALKEAIEIIEAWRIDYNTLRPYTSLGGLTPTAFATRPTEGHNLTRLSSIPPSASEAAIAIGHKSGTLASDGSEGFTACCFAIALPFVSSDRRNSAPYRRATNASL